MAAKKKKSYRKKSRKKITRNQNKLSEDEARLAWLKKDEKECLREIKEYQNMQKFYSKWPVIAQEIEDEIEAAKNGLFKTRTDIRVLEQQMSIKKRQKDH